MNRPVHFEIHSPDTTASRAFFEEVFSWNFSEWPGPEEYHLADTGNGEGINGGLLPSRDGAPRTVITMKVENVDNTCAAVQSAGGQVVVPKMPIPGVGYLAYCTDPGGAIFGVMHDDVEAG